MKVRVSDAFVLKFALELDRMEQNVVGGEYGTHRVPLKSAVEEFLVAMAPDLAQVLKHQLLETLLADTAALVPVPEAHSATGTTIPIDNTPARA